MISRWGCETKLPSIAMCVCVYLCVPCMCLCERCTSHIASIRHTCVCKILLCTTHKSLSKALECHLLYFMWKKNEMEKKSTFRYLFVYVNRIAYASQTHLSILFHFVNTPSPIPSAECSLSLHEYISEKGFFSSTSLD